MNRGIAVGVGVVVAAAAAVVTYLVMFQHVAGNLARAGESGRMTWMIALVALVFGTWAHALTFKVLERRARRRAEDAQIPRAQIR